MRLAEVESDIKKYRGDLDWFGGGESEITRIETEIGHVIPKEFKIYLEQFVPKNDLNVGMFYQGFALYGKAKLKLENSSPWGYFPKAEGIVLTPFVIGDDAAIAFITDLAHEDCPVYRVDEVWNWQPKQIANTLADFLLILFFQNYATEKWLEDFNLYGNEEANRLNEKLDNEVQQLILRLCPESVKLWT